MEGTSLPIPAAYAHVHPCALASTLPWKSHVFTVSFYSHFLGRQAPLPITIPRCLRPRPPHVHASMGFWLETQLTSRRTAQANIWPKRVVTHSWESDGRYLISVFGYSPPF